MDISFSILVILLETNLVAAGNYYGDDPFTGSPLFDAPQFGGPLFGAPQFGGPLFGVPQVGKSCNGCSGDKPVPFKTNFDDFRKLHGFQLTELPLANTPTGTPTKPRPFTNTAFANFPPPPKTRPFSNPAFANIPIKPPSSKLPPPDRNTAEEPSRAKDTSNIDIVKLPSGTTPVKPSPAKDESAVDIVSLPSGTTPVKPSGAKDESAVDIVSLPSQTKPISVVNEEPVRKGQSQPPTNNDQKPETMQQPATAACNWCLRPNCNPGACKPAANFNAITDAEKLRDAIAEAGTNEEVMFDILMNRSEEQIELIKREYLSFGKNSLEDDVKGDTMLKVQDLLLAFLKSRSEFIADELQQAFKDLKDNTMVLLLTSLPPCAIKEVGSTFNERHGETLKKASKKATTLKFQEFFEEIIKANREPEGDVDDDKVIKDAADLHAAGPDSYMFKKKRVFIDIFTHRSFDHIRKVKEYYNKAFEPDFQTTITKHSGGGKLTAGLLAILRNIEDQPGYFADEIEGALQHLITNGIRDNQGVIRILRGRCGIDLGDIRDAYPKNHDGKALVEVIKGKTFGDYENALVKLLS